MTNLFYLILLFFIINKTIYASESFLSKITNNQRNLDKQDDDDEKKECSVYNCNKCRIIIIGKKNIYA